ncbi:MAG: sulfatase [Planctomycetaceae bacterium]|nr:sulfatase [Planctomycetaceae bacterium]
MVALTGLMTDDAHAEPGADDQFRGPRQPHFRPRAKNVIFCYMSGGVSHVDSFDPKPRLAKEAGKPMPGRIERTQFNNNGTIQPNHWAFKQYGGSGIPVSDLFPHIGSCADDLAVIRSMTAKFSEHAQGNYFMHTGFPFLGFPSAGAWATYGLGSESKNLPGFVVLRSGGSAVPHGGVGLFSNGFLPADHQASIINADEGESVRNIKPRESNRVQRARLDFIGRRDRQFLKTLDENTHIESAIKNYEMAYRMQSAVPELADLSDETEVTKKMYGLDARDGRKAAYARQCLLARRLVERGVRFVELTCLAYNIGGGNGANPWDHHSELKEGHTKMARQVDQPIAALIKDLKQRGMLDETLVVWAGEFGRTPFAQGTNGRDHDPFGFSIWLAGGGIQGGTIYGATDDYGYFAVEKKCTVYDLWATVLHQLGINHMNLTYRYGGRDFRLTDVHGNVLDGIMG